VTVLKTRDVDRALVSKLGFEKTETHYHVYRLWLEGKLAARTYISHAGRELSAYHTSQMAKQMRLRTAEFVDAVNCSLTTEEYYRILRGRASGLDKD